MVVDFYDALGSAPALELPLGVGNRLRSKSVAFELLMEEIRDLLSDDGRATVADLLVGVFSLGTPNVHHRALAQLLRSGEIDALLTTNFDLHLANGGPALGAAASPAEIEHALRALRDRPQKSRPLADVVVYLHSSVNHPAELDAFMTRVGEPVSGPRRDLLNLMHDRAFRYAFIGYRGEDTDLIPLLSPESNWRANPRIGRTAKPDGEPAPERTVYFDLDPSGADHQPARDVIHAWTDGLQAGDRHRVAGLLLQRSGQLELSCARYRAALRIAPGGPATTFGLAVATADQMLYGRAIAVLATEPDPTSVIYMRWVAFRGLLKRLTGHEQSALNDFERARSAITHLPDTEPERAHLIMALCQEIEAQIIVASSLKKAARERQIGRSRELLLEAVRLADRSPSVPRHDIDFYRAEIAMISGHYDTAAVHYARFAAGVKRWRPGTEGRVGDARRIASLAFAGRRRLAAQEFRAQVRLAARNRWPMVLLHTLAAGVIVVLPSPRLFWWLRRRVGPWVYRMTESVIARIQMAHRGPNVFETRPDHDQSIPPSAPAQ